VTLAIVSTCEKIRGLSADIAKVDSFQETGDGFEGGILKAVRTHLKGCCFGDDRKGGAISGPAISSLVF